MIARVEGTARSYAATAISCGVGEKKEGEKKEGQKEKERKQNKGKEKEKEKEKREIREKEKIDEENNKEREKVKDNSSSREKQILLSEEIVLETPILTESQFTESQLTESQRKILFLASEMKRISDPFLVFDSDGIEVQDPPDYYSADCLGEKN